MSATGGIPPEGEFIAVTRNALPALLSAGVTYGATPAHSAAGRQGARGTDEAAAGEGAAMRLRGEWQGTVDEWLTSQRPSARHLDTSRGYAVCRARGEVLRLAQDPEAVTCEACRATAKWKNRAAMYRRATP